MFLDHMLFQNQVATIETSLRDSLDTTHIYITPTLSPTASRSFPHPPALETSPPLSPSFNPTKTKNIWPADQYGRHVKACQEECGGDYPPLALLLFNNSTLNMNVAVGVGWYWCKDPSIEICTLECCFCAVPASRGCVRYRRRFRPA